MCIACECAGDECNKRDRSSGLDRGRCSIGFARHGSHPKKNLCLRRVEFGEIGSHIFRRPNVRQVTNAKSFLKGGRRKQKKWQLAMKPNSVKHAIWLKQSLSWGISLVSSRPPKLSDFSTVSVKNGSRRRRGISGHSGRTCHPFDCVEWPLSGRWWRSGARWHSNPPESLRDGHFPRTDT